jgi:hypothetical protein
MIFQEGFIQISKNKRLVSSLRKVEGVYGINDGEQELRHLLVVSLRRQLKTGFGRLECICEACKKESYLCSYDLYGPLRTVMFLMHADPLRGQAGGGWPLQIETFGG